MKIVNRSARYNYEILETFESGIDLLGPEVKSVRAGQVSLNESFVHLRDGQAYLINAHIHPYQNSVETISPTRSRKLLLHKKELMSLRMKLAENNYTLVGMAIYETKSGLLKVEIGLAMGKKKQDKRRDLKEKDLQRDTDRELKNYT